LRNRELRIREKWGMSVVKNTARLENWHLAVLRWKGLDASARKSALGGSLDFWSSMQYTIVRPILGLTNSRYVFLT
jgi:hypothetical protein